METDFVKMFNDLGQNLEAVFAAFVALVGTIYTIFTGVAVVWDKIFPGNKAHGIVEKIGAFFRRWSLLPDDKDAKLLELPSKDK